MLPSSSICRLAFIIRDLGHGGAQRQLTVLAVALAQKAGWEVTVIHFYPGPFEAELKAAGVRTLCIGKKSRWDLAGFFWRLIKAVHGVRPDVIHGYLNEGNLMSLLVKPFCSSPRPKVIWGLRDSQTDAHLWGWLGRLSFWLNCRLSQFANLIIANSKAGKAYYTAQGYPQERMEVVPNGIDAARFAEAPDAQRTGLKTKFVFGMVGRLNAMKGHDTFLAAAGIVAAKVPEARFKIVGGREESDPDRVPLMVLAEKAALGEKVAWVPAQRDMPAVYRGLDCLVSASKFGEGFSNVIGEAMACGVPCVATDVGDSAWLVDDVERVCPPDNAEALAACMIRTATTTSEERARLGSEGRQRILEHFTVEKMIERTHALVLGQMRPIRVCFVTTGLGTGGAEMMLWQITTRLDLARFQVSVISLAEGGKYVERLRQAGIRVEVLGMPAGKPTMNALWRLLKAAREIKPDVLMGWMYHGCLAAFLARQVFMRRIPMVWNIRQSLYDLALEKRGSALVIRALAFLSWLPRTITYNSQVSARQHEAVGYRAKKTLLIPNGFDTERWQPGAGAREQGLRVGRFGRYASMKDYPTLLEAAALVVKQMPEVKFVLAGTGVDEANAELCGHIARLNLGGNVQLLGEREDLPELTASLDLVVSSSAFGEGFPNVVGEAMACGVPVVATDIGDTAWVLGDTGRMVPARNPEALAAACVKVLSLSSDERAKLGTAGRQRIEQQFSLASVMAQFESLLRAHSVRVPGPAKELP